MAKLRHRTAPRSSGGRGAGRVAGERGKQDNSPHSPSSPFRRTSEGRLPSRGPRGARTLSCGLTAEKVAAAKLREGDTRASGGEGKKESSSEFPLLFQVPEQTKRRRAAAGFSLSPLLPLSLPSPPRPLPLPASPARPGTSEASLGGSVPSPSQLCPDPLLPLPRPKLSPGDACPGPLHTHHAV